MANEYEDIFNLEQAVEDTNSRNAFQKVIDYSNSDHPDKRLAAVLCLTEALSIIEGNEEDSEKVLHTLLQFAEDPEVAIRRTLARQLNEIANNLQQKPGFKDFLSDYIFPAYLKLATDSDGEIRKGAHMNLLSLIRYQSLTKDEVSKLLIEVKEMTEQNRSDEIRTDAIGLLTNLAMTLDVSTAQSVLLSKFLNLCSDQAFSVRKACAVNFADMCASISQKNLEIHLLPKFSGLCEDSVWGVRKACAESLVEISRHCSDSVRKKQLVPLLLGLLRDISRWVRSSAYQSLGPFIVTFANFHTSIDGTDKQEKDDDDDDIFSHQLILGSDADTALEIVSDIKSEDVKGICHNEVTGKMDLAATVTDSEGYDARTGADTSEVRRCLVKEAVIDDDDDDPQGVHAKYLASSTTDAMSDVDIVSSISKSDTKEDTDSLSDNVFITSAQPYDNIPRSSDTDGVEPSGGTNITIPDVAENKLMEEEHKAVTLSRDINNAPTTIDADGSHIDNVTSDDIQVKVAGLLSETTENIAAPERPNNNGDGRTPRQDAKIVCSENVDKTSSLDLPVDITAIGRTVIDTDNDDRVTRTSCETGNVSDTIAPTDAPDTILEAGSDETSTNARGSKMLTAEKVDPNDKLQNRNAGTESENKTGELTKCQPDEHSESEKKGNRQNNGTARFVNAIVESSEHTNFDVASEISDNCSCSSDDNGSGCVDTLSPSKPSRDLRLVHPASVSVVSEPGEEMTKNIGSMNVEVTDELNIVDGLVQPAENLVKINITRQAIVTLQQDTLESEIPKTDDMIRRANVVHIPAKTSPIPIRRPLLKKSPGIPRFGYPSGILPSVDDSHEPSSAAAELSSLEIANKTLSADQSIVPCELLEQYLNMAEPSRSQTVDGDILKHCAFSLPGVAKTLGQRNWACLRQLYQHLARNMQWQVRRTLALSIHEMASILGSDLMTSELLPVFDELIKDLDEVRSGIVKNLSRFLQLLPERVRICYLPKLDAFLVTETNTRWRYRQDFAQQLISLVALFHPNDVHLHILPLAFVLISDKVSEVRHTAVQLVGTILGMLLEKDNDSFIEVFEDLKKRLLCSTVWYQRQLFIFLSQSVHDSESIGFKDFLVHFLPSLLTLCKDSIPNIRITLARLLSHVVITHSDFLTSHESVHQHELLDAFDALRKDKDSDVRYYISPMTSRLLSIV